MGTPSRRTSPSVAETLYEEGYRFDFFQAVRLLAQIFPDRPGVGRSGPPHHEAVRFRSHLSLSFPPSAIHGLTKPNAGGEPVDMVVNFMGLTGSSGALPRHYTELLMERGRIKDTALLHFLDIFHHRLISLFYRVWEKHSIAAQYEHAVHKGVEEDKPSQYLFALMGLGTKGLRNRMLTQDRSILSYSGLLSQRPRSASALQQCLQGYFEIPVNIEQMIGAWINLGENDLTRLGMDGLNNRLGQTAIAGTKVWDQQAKFCVHLGPLSREQFEAVLPAGHEYGALVRLTKYFAGPAFEFDVHPILQKEEVPACYLGGTSGFTPHLGWNTWIQTQPRTQDAADVVFQGHLVPEMAGTA